MNDSDIREVRRFNRAVVQRIGALNADFLGRGRPMAESRLLFEIGEQGCEVRELRSRLSLDSGYLSRLLRSLERQRLITTQPSERDRRAVRAMPTPDGLAEIRELDDRSDVFAASVLEPLSERQRQSLLAAMSDLRKLLRAASVQISAESATGSGAEYCLQKYYAELAERFTDGFDASLSIPADPAELTPPNGVFVVARLDGRPIGCGALKCKGAAVAEIKRMWVAGEARGLGIGRRILRELENHAIAFGIDVLQLETNRTLHEAQALYRKSGFEEVDAFNDERYAHHWFQKSGIRAQRGDERGRES